MPRRRALLSLLTLLPLPVVSGLAGCGFRLVAPPTYRFRSIALVGFAADSPLAAELRRTLAPQVRIQAVPADAEVVLQALVDRRERSAAATTAAGQVRELQLRLLATVRADTPAGRPLMAPVALRLVRELSTTEAASLAKAAEEAEIFREMQSDVVAQLLRRLSTVVP
jgi:LPS-assembly lipoprotein